jgi:membrane protein DedA with SNARE-associated domain
LENLLLYRMARIRGSSLLVGADTKAVRLRRVLEFVRVRGAWILFASRFLVGWRSAVALACGIAEMPQGKFFWTNLVGAAVWTAFMTAVGYSGGELMPAIVADVKQHEWTIAGVIALAVFCAVLLRGHARDWQDRWHALFHRS